MDLVEIYRETGDFHLAIQKSGTPLSKGHLILLQSGVLKIQDKIKYGSQSQVLGAKAEELFQKLVPEAIDANKFWQKNNPVYDFYLNGLTIDVKFSSVRDIGVRRPKLRWKIRCSGNQDFTLAFLERYEGAGLEDCYILAIPNAFLTQKNTIDIYEGSPVFKEFLTSERNLENILLTYSEFKKEG